MGWGNEIVFFFFLMFFVSYYENIFVCVME